MTKDLICKVDFNFFHQFLLEVLKHTEKSSILVTLMIDFNGGKK